jgi:hypothetical protein
LKKTKKVVLLDNALNPKKIIKKLLPYFFFHFFSGCFWWVKIYKLPDGKQPKTAKSG